VLGGVRDSEVLDDDVRFCLVLPHEAVSVPVMRRVLAGTLLGFGADEDCVADILLAATEACTNVLRHGERAQEYQVSARMDADDCLLEIANGPGNGLADSSAYTSANGKNGKNGKPRAVPQPEPEDAAPDPDEDFSQIPESGRGLSIMQACMDDLTLRGTPSNGTVVSMRKRITWAPESPGRHAAGPDPALLAAALRQAG
jgi:serine/threonine-protein kinase RsbW